MRYSPVDFRPAVAASTDSGIDPKGMARRDGRGLFAGILAERMPLLPLEEEGRLNDMPLRENFVERVFAYYRWTEMLDKQGTPGGLVKFHTAHKLTLMAP